MKKIPIYSTSKRYTKLLHKVIKKEAGIGLSHLVKPSMVKVIIVKNKNSYKFAEIKKVSSDYRLFLDFDFLIIIYVDTVSKHLEKLNCHSSKRQLKFIKILLLHELLHINSFATGLIKHDVEDFRYIIKKYGINWPITQSVKIVKKGGKYGK